MGWARPIAHPGLAVATSLLAILSLGQRCLAQTPDQPVKPSLFRCSANTTSLTFALRSDFTDETLYGCPSGDKGSLPEAEGALASLKLDQRAHTTAIAGDGLLLGVLRYYPAGPALQGVMLGPYLQGNGTYQIPSGGQAEKKTDLYTAGGFLQVGLSNDLVQGQDYFRIRAGQARSNAAITYTTVVGEWLPYYGKVFGSPIPIGGVSSLTGGHLFYSLQPEIMIQYDHLDEGKNSYTIFSRKSEDLRVGPQLTLKLWVNTGLEPKITAQPLQTFLDNSAISLTYHGDVDAQSGARYSWAQAVYLYNSDPHYALSLSYGYGNMEATGNMASQVKIGLAAKY